MNKKFATIFALVCIVAALGAGISVVVRVYDAQSSGREAAKADFEGLRSVLAYVKDVSDLADPGLRARLATRYETSSGLLFVDIYDRSSGDVWRIPSSSPYLSRSPGSPLQIGAEGSTLPGYPGTTSILLSAPLKGDPTGRLAVDALYTSLPQLAIFEAFRDALIALGAFLAVAALVLAIVFGSTLSSPADSAEDEPSFESENSDEAEQLAAAGALYQHETMGSEAQDDDFDIPIMGGSGYEYAEKESADSASSAAATEKAEEIEPSFGLAIKAGPEEIPGSSDSEAVSMDLPPPESFTFAEQVDLPEEESITETGREPEGLYSPDSGLGWESYLGERLDAELSRSASFEQDLSLLLFSYDNLQPGDQAYRKISATIKELFSFRDLAFERPGGFSIILPNMDSAHALRKAEDFYKKLVFLADGDFAELEQLPVYLGLSSRAGRLVDSKRLEEEAQAALAKSRSEKGMHLVAFKPDPDKYRLYLASKGA